MELINEQEFNSYIQSNYKKILEGEKWEDLKSEYDGFCDTCSRDVFLKVHSRSFQNTTYREQFLPTFITYFIECPRCSRKSFIQCVLIDATLRPETDEDYEGFGNNAPKFKKRYELYRLYSIPIKEDNYAIRDIPDKFKTLRESLAEALFSMYHGKYVSAAIMFRRAMQIIAKEILGAKGHSLNSQLEWLKQNKNSLDIDLTGIFHENSKLIKDVGNQGAHPDDDITLQNFTEKDVLALHDLFLIIVNEIFVKPEQLKAIQSELVKNRKLK